VTDTVLADGDFARAANGRPYSVGGAEEMLQHAAIRLTVPKGSFCYDALLGSRLHELTGSEADVAEAALPLARDALRSLPGVAAVRTEYDAETRVLTITVAYGGMQRKIEVVL
jgi:hypothetical protein